mmetsp:Transcript_59174/g.136550  ORF Transcript_59174/g.136550 Transcript_59174/m.136550 type:complete len:159 (+) Transcript_59174:425-901(+)
MEVSHHLYRQKLQEVWPDGTAGSTRIIEGIEDARLSRNPFDHSMWMVFGLRTAYLGRLDVGSCSESGMCLASVGLNDTTVVAFPTEWQPGVSHAVKNLCVLMFLSVDLVLIHFKVNPSIVLQLKLTTGVWVPMLLLRKCTGFSPDTSCSVRISIFAAL